MIIAIYFLFFCFAHFLIDASNRLLEFLVSVGSESWHNE